MRCDDSLARANVWGARGIHRSYRSSTKLAHARSMQRRSRERAARAHAHSQTHARLHASIVCAGSSHHGPQQRELTRARAAARVVPPRLPMLRTSGPCCCGCARPSTAPHGACELGSAQGHFQHEGRDGAGLARQVHPAAATVRRDPTQRCEYCEYSGVLMALGVVVRVLLLLPRDPSRLTWLAAHHRPETYAHSTACALFGASLRSGRPRDAGTRIRARSRCCRARWSGRG